MADWQGGLAVSAVPGLEIYWHGGCPGDRPLPTACTSSTGCCHFTRSAAANIKLKSANTCEVCPTSRWVFRSYLHGLHSTSPLATRICPGCSWTATLITPNQSHRLYLRRAVDCHPRSYSHLLEGRQFDGKKQSGCVANRFCVQVLPALAAV